MKKASGFVKGFTLVELLVVIAIIGILSSVVMGSISSTRIEAFDSKVKSQLGNIRSAAESYFGAHYNYGATAIYVCDGGMFIDGPSGMANLTATSSYPEGVSLVCHTSGTAYAVSGNLNGENKFWCVDSLGTSKLQTVALAGTEVVCAP